MTFDPDSLRTVMRRWASGVSVVTGRHDGEIHGMTVSSFTSLSLTPPLVLVALEQTSRTHQIVTASQRFLVAILAEDQKSISDRFAGRVADDLDRFEGIEYWQADSGCPVPAGSLAYLDCQLTASHDAGTHTVFIGQVQQADVLRQAPPLLYFDQHYRQFAADE